MGSEMCIRDSNMHVKETLDKVDEHLKQRFQKSAKSEEESVRKEAYNFQLGKDTAITLDKLERLRSKIGASLCKKDSATEKTKAPIDGIDKWLLRDFLEKSRGKGRVNEYE